MPIVTILAQSQPDLNWPETLKVEVGIVGLLMIVWLVFSVAIASRKLFGRKPPFSDELDKIEKRLHDEILEVFARASKSAEEAKQQAERVRLEMDGKIQKLDEKLSRVPGEVIANLANALTVATQTTKSK